MVTDRPSSTTFAKPRNAIKPARVTMMDSTLKYTIAPTLMAETNNAAARPLINPIINECFSVMTTNAAADSATAEPTDMSICRATKSNVIGQAITPTTDALTMMLVKFSAPKK